MPDLVGPYFVVRRLGTGGMGTVHLARVAGDAGERETGLGAGEFVAVKLMHSDLARDDVLRARFVREADLGRAVRHPNVVRTYATGVHEDEIGELHYLVLEFVEGQTLRNLALELDRLPEELCRHVGIEIAQGLAAIHACGAVHRDLKPENVLITADQRVRIMDFGVARPIDAATALTAAGEFAGSLWYAAPEQFSENESVSPATDLWSLGVLLYELLSGARPFAGGSFRTILNAVLHDAPAPLQEVAPGISPWFAELVDQLLHKEPGQRLRPAEQVAQALADGETSAWWRSHTIRARATAPRSATVPALRAPRDTALFGRADELARLRAAFDDVRAGRGRVVLLRGEAGIGKTRLVEEFVRTLDRAGDPLHVLAGAFPPGGAATAAGAFRSAFREHFGDADLASAVAVHLRAAPSLAPAFAALLRGEPLPPGAAAAGEESLQTAFVEVSRSLAGQRPTLLVVDDLHDAPQAGRALFAALAAAHRTSPLLLLGTIRPGVAEDWVAELERQPHVGVMELARLAADDLVKLLEDALGSAALAERLGAPISRKSDGNPYFAFEILRALREERRIVRAEDGAWTSTGEIVSIEIPSTVRALIASRVADVSEDERDLLDVAACCGFRFDPLLVGEIVDLRRIAVLKRLARIERTHRLLRADGRDFVFDHHQVQEVLYEALPEGLREEYHTAIADAVLAAERAVGEDVGGAVALRICFHGLRGGCPDRALPFLGRALDHLESEYRNEAAVELAERALGIDGLLGEGERLELLLRTAHRAELLGWRERGLSSLEEAGRLAADLGDPLLRARAGHDLTRHLRSVARYDEGRRVALRVVADAEESGDLVMQSRAWRNLGWLAYVLGDIDDALRALERQGDLAERAGDRAEQSLAAEALGILLNYLGRATQAREHFQRRLALAQELGDRYGEAAAAGNLGNVLHALGEFAGACRQHEHNIELARAIGARQSESHARGNLGNLLRDLGRTRDALDQQARSLELARERADRRHECICLFNMGLAYLRVGAHEPAREHIAEAGRIGEEIEFQLLCACARLGFAELARDEGRLDEAERIGAFAEERMRALAYRPGLAEVLVLRGTVAAERGAPDEAAARFDAAAELARELRQPGTRMAAVAERCVLVRGDREAAEALVAEVEDRATVADRLRARFALWRATSHAEHLEAARAHLRTIEEGAPAAYRAAVVACVPLHRALAAAAGAP